METPIWRLMTEEDTKKYIDKAAHTINPKFAEIIEFRQMDAKEKLAKWYEEFWQDMGREKE
jgi:hypothetical protein